MGDGIFKKIKNVLSKQQSVEPETPETVSRKTINDSAKAAEAVKPGSKAVKAREIVTDKAGKTRDMFRYLIEPEERTMKNYLNPGFWMEKRKEYSEIRQKEREDLNIYGILFDGARPTIEYYILTVLSCIIATTGLIQGSAATIIGAMIVAPLMTPILAFSLGVIWGDTELISTSMKSIIKGLFLAVAISSIIAFLVPIPNYTSEIISRARPSLFDIIVAVTSGLVGAYGYANKRISNSLVGIAIAVALMPPLCTIGIGIGTLNIEVATGATLLFLINLISISLAGAIVFWSMKIHPVLSSETGVNKRAIYQIVISLLILTGISIPVGFYMVDGYRLAISQEKVRNIIKEDLPGSEIVQMKTIRLPKGYRLDLTLTGTSNPDSEVIDKMRKHIVERSIVIGEMHIRFIQSASF
jgi:uncharacterized hydrophobic protein (TIGR00271 family)